jgi:hypothetical protein
MELPGQLVQPLDSRRQVPQLQRHDHHPSRRAGMGGGDGTGRAPAQVSSLPLAPAPEADSRGGPISRPADEAEALSLT